MKIADYQPELDSSMTALRGTTNLNLDPPLLNRIALLRRALTEVSRAQIEYNQFIDHERFKSNLPQVDDITEQKINFSLDCIARAVYRKYIMFNGRTNAIEREILLHYSHFNSNISDDEKFEALYHNLLISEFINQQAGKISQAQSAVGTTAKAYEEKLENWQKEMARLETYVKNLQTEFNFVGLSKAFLDMEQKSINEKRFLNIGMFSIAIIILLIPLLSLVGGAESLWRVGPSDQDLDRWRPIILIASMELILVYFFRVLLKQQQSSKAQILQLRLRRSLCAFIEGYTDFARGKRDDVHLQRFEALIFSGLTPTPENVPSTFDGLDPIVKVIKEARGG